MTIAAAVMDQTGAMTDTRVSIYTVGAEGRTGVQVAHGTLIAPSLVLVHSPAAISPDTGLRVVMAASTRRGIEAELHDVRGTRISPARADGDPLVALELESPSRLPVMRFLAETHGDLPDPDAALVAAMGAHLARTGSRSPVPLPALDETGDGFPFDHDWPGTTLRVFCRLFGWGCPKP
jgi:hypothetical protein